MPSQMSTKILQKIQRKMSLPLFVNLHEHERGLMSVLAGIGQASRIQHNQILISFLFLHLVEGPVGMPEHNDIETSGSGLLLQVLSSHRDISNVRGSEGSYTFQ